jgi:hypothetical protein
MILRLFIFLFDDKKKKTKKQNKKSNAKIFSNKDEMIVCDYFII